MYAWLWTLEQSLLHYWNVQGKGRKPLAYVSPRPASNLDKNSHITLPGFLDFTLGLEVNYYGSVIC
jgi:hypothetical protein